MNISQQESKIFNVIQFSDERKVSYLLPEHASLIIYKDNEEIVISLLELWKNDNKIFIAKALDNTKVQITLSSYIESVSLPWNLQGSDINVGNFNFQV